jgi:polyisoprenyl-phosphate glycosyltransferase
MKKIIILIPVFNDWDSLKKLINEIEINVRKLRQHKFNFIVINDGSTVFQPEINKPKDIDLIKIINMKKNKGHTKCIAFGINYILQNEEFDNLILMDGDGEDRPQEIENFIVKNSKNPNNSIVAKRVKRAEGILFKMLYQLHKLLTLIFTGHKINFGNFTFLTKEDLNIISNKKSLWKSYSGTFKKYLKDYQEIDSTRGTRYFGPSKMSIIKLILHSLSIIAVFKYQVFLRSTFMVIVLAYLNIYLGNISIFFQISIILFNLIIFAVSIEKNKDNVQNSENNLSNIKNITH